MTTSSDDIPIIEEPDPLDPEDAAEIAPLDSEIDYDDEQEEDQLPLDERKRRRRACCSTTPKPCPTRTGSAEGGARTRIDRLESAKLGQPVREWSDEDRPRT